MLIRFSRPALSGVQYTEGTRTAYEAATPTIPYEVSQPERKLPPQLFVSALTHSEGDGDDRDKGQQTREARDAEGQRGLSEQSHAVGCESGRRADLNPQGSDVLLRRRCRPHESGADCYDV